MTAHLTDRPALLRFRARAARTGDPPLFLHAEAAAEIKERLSEVNRSFTAPAIVTGWPGFWGNVLPGARIVADDAELALTPQAHDLVIHAMALHWADDPVGQLIQCRRALRPDGLMLAVCPGGRTLAELRAALAEAEAAEDGGLSPRVHPMADLRVLGALLQRAGFAMPVADADRVEVHYPDALSLMRDLRAMAETNALHARRRVPLRRATLAHAAAAYAARFPAPEGRVRAGFEICTLTGWAPGPDQPRPKRPGSATARLADALGAEERPAGEKAGGDGTAGDGPDRGRTGR